MSDDNPFVRLGLQKELVQSLHRRGKLGEFLRTHYRSLQHYIHPDKGGDNALAAKVNSAYGATQRQPENIESWVRSMSDGNSVNPEYLTLIEGLTAKVEELQGVEREYRTLQEKYAELLAARTGDGTKAEVRTASPRARREEASEDIPPVKKPTAGRIYTDTAEGVKTKEKVSTIKPIVLTDLISYGMDGKPRAKYTAYLDGEAVRKADGSYLAESQKGFEKYFASTKDGRGLPSLMEWYAIFERLHDTKNPALSGIIADLKESWLCTGTKIDYKNNVLTQPGYRFIECTIPEGSHWLDEVVKNRDWRNALQALFGPKEVEKVPDVLQAISGKRPYIWTPDTAGRKSHHERALWLLILAGGFGLCCNGFPVGGGGRARGVRLESA